MLLVSFYSMVFEREWYAYLDAYTNLFQTVLNGQTILSVFYSE